MEPGTGTFVRCLPADRPPRNIPDWHYRAIRRISAGPATGLVDKGKPRVTWGRKATGLARAS